MAPIFGVLAGLDTSVSDGADDALQPRASTRTADQEIPPALGTPSLLAVLLLSVVAAGLVRTTMQSRRTKKSS